MKAGPIAKFCFEIHNTSKMSEEELVYCKVFLKDTAIQTRIKRAITRELLKYPWMRHTEIKFFKKVL